MKKGIVFFILICSLSTINAKDGGFVWFPDSAVFPNLAYDLLECQFYTGTFSLEAKKTKYTGAYIPVNIGVKKAFLQWQGQNITVQLLLGAASYTQFEIIRYNNNTLRGGLLNNDYKASAYISAAIGKHKFRSQLFHISSHLGDDYMLRNNYFEYNDKTVNYEQLDILYLYQFKYLEPYVGLGYVVTPYAYRERFMIQTGFQGSWMFHDNFALAYGSDLKFYQENYYETDIHSCIGVNVITKNKPQIAVLFDTYYGKMPYSTLKMGNVFWYGLSGRVMF